MTGHFAASARLTITAGLALLVASASTAAAREERSPDGFATAEECLTWVDETYRLASLGEELGLDLEETIAEVRACTEHDTHHMALPIPRTWCDNVFKIHCSGLDLLAQVGDALVARCERLLSDTLGVDIANDETWITCGEAETFDRYSTRGEASDAAACEEIYAEVCGGATADADDGEAR